jgi:hypothetical protein
MHTEGNNPFSHLSIEKVPIVGSELTALPEMAWFAPFSSRFSSVQKDPVYWLQQPLFHSPILFTLARIRPARPFIASICGVSIATNCFFDVGAAPPRVKVPG